MGWLADYLNDDSRGPRNDPAWRERHPECTQPTRKAGTSIYLGPTWPSDKLGWDVHPEMYDWPSS